MPENDDIKFMRRCLDLAGKAEGMTYPNPMVGCVVVFNGKIIGEGYHQKAGEPHAEVNAVNSVKNRNLLKSSILYVNLEPCSHFGKTPPCTEMIIASGIRKVIAGTKDTSRKVSGEGIKELRNADCEVVAGVMEEECRWINRRFFCYHEKNRPYIILKWAQSADGYIDIIRKPGHSREPFWITGRSERVLVHRWRASEQAILAGAGTVRTDDPKLNVRYWTGNDPLRLILSSSGRLDGGSAIFKINGTNIVFTHNDKIKQINGLKVKLDKYTASTRQVAEYLFSEGIQSVIIEGGREVLSHFISTGYWDEARIFYGKNEFKEGVLAPGISGKIISRTDFSGSTLKIVENEMSQQPEMVDNYN
jgi:diaminohydroxyphosphoribosylaminopyrimidine deaminase/5-amino-6-(5-phosphoribosylamino)uracil reductase